MLGTSIRGVKRGAGGGCYRSEEAVNGRHDGRLPGAGGAGPYELYCEEPDEPAAPADERAARSLPAPRAPLPRDARGGRARAPPRSRDRTIARPAWLARVKARTLRWVAESIAEQRLLWQLRGRTRPGSIYPDDLHRDAGAIEVLRRSLQRDCERHRFWLVDRRRSGCVASGAPDPPSRARISSRYYFVFRIVGHYPVAPRRAAGPRRRSRGRGAERAALARCARWSRSRRTRAPSASTRSPSTLRLEHLAQLLRAHRAP